MKKKKPVTVGSVPWLVPECVEWLAGVARPGMRVLEFGSGGSTIWFAERGCEVVSIEHDADWWGAVAARVQGREVTCALAKRPYASVALELLGPCSVDLVLIDGRDRVACAAVVPRVLRPGGWLLLDNAERERYQPIFDRFCEWPLRRWECRDQRRREVRYAEGGVWVTVAWRRAVRG